MNPIFEPTDFGDNQIPDMIETINARMFAKPRLGIKAADLLPPEKMWLLRGAGVPMKMEFEGTIVRMVTTVPCGIADRGDGTYIIAMGRA